jgi:hypothetical protein
VEIDACYGCASRGRKMEAWEGVKELKNNLLKNKKYK